MINYFHHVESGYFFSFSFSNLSFKAKISSNKTKQQKIQNQGWLLPWGQGDSDDSRRLYLSPTAHPARAQASPLKPRVCPGKSHSCICLSRGAEGSVAQQVTVSCAGESSKLPQTQLCSQGDWWESVVDLCARPSLPPPLDNNSA